MSLQTFYPLLLLIINPRPQKYVSHHGLETPKRSCIFMMEFIRKASWNWTWITPSGTFHNVDGTVLNSLVLHFQTFASLFRNALMMAPLFHGMGRKIFTSQVFLVTSQLLLYTALFHPVPF